MIIALLRVVWDLLKLIIDFMAGMTLLAALNDKPTRNAARLYWRNVRRAMFPEDE